MKKKYLKNILESINSTVELEYLKASIRALVEHTFMIIKCQFGFEKHVIDD